MFLLFIQESKGRCLCWLPSREGNLEYQGKVWENSSSQFIKTQVSSDNLRSNSVTGMKVAMATVLHTYYSRDRSAMPHGIGLEGSANTIGKTGEKEYSRLIAMERENREPQSSAA